MGSKNLIAVLATTVFLTAVGAFALVRTRDAVTAPPAAAPALSAHPESAREGRESPVRARPQVATQKLMRNPWERPVESKSANAAFPVECDAGASSGSSPCIYY